MSGGVGYLEYRNLLSDHGRDAGSGEVSRPLEGVELRRHRQHRPPQRRHRALPGVDPMDLHGRGTTAVTARPGDPSRLGAFWDGGTTSFAVLSSAGGHGGSVELCLLDEAGNEERVPLFVNQDVWHARVEGVVPGQLYGYRASGPMDPGRGLRFDPATLLLDPYARAMAPAGGSGALRSLVVDEAFDWGDDRPPRRPWADTVLYEAHVKGISIRHPGVPEKLRGTYAGLASPPILDHLVGLGVTAVELMPVHQFVTEEFLVRRGLTNYWGYSSIGYFAPHSAYSSAGDRGQQVAEFKTMVAAMHRAGLEVILDVVYNHTGEGDAGAPTLSLRGLGNDVYYRLDPADPGRYLDTTGTGNSLNTGSCEVLRLILDSLRYWVTEMHVDGFRFDLAAALARQHGFVDRLAAFFGLVYQDPVVSRVKLIAEPWDVGAPDSYQVGRFPAGWVEWNDRYRDGVRDFWRGASGVADLAYRLTGSSDLYGATRRGPDASVNFVTAHDGKTLTDLVTYEGKYNQANREDNRDGSGFDRAANYGVEGPTDDPAVVATRQRQRRNLLATLLLSQGVPMISGGDEIGRTQRGNNNAYCQDNDISWSDWNLKDDARSLLAFAIRATGIMRDHPTLRRRTFLHGRTNGGPLPDVSWYQGDGSPMTDEAWQDPGTQFVALLYAGDMTDARDETGRPLLDDDVLLVCNATTETKRFTVPGRPGATFTLLLDTAQPDGAPVGAAAAVGSVLEVPGRTVLAAAARLA